MQTQNYDDMTTGAGAAGSSTTSTGSDSMTRRDPAERIDRAAQTAHDTVDRVHRRALEMSERATTEGDRMYQASCAWVSAHPLQAVLGAFVAGYLYARMRH